MKGIIIKKWIAQDDLILHFLDQSGKLVKLRLPRVLKSKKRTSPFWIHGTLWDVVIQGNPKEYIIPKEMNLLFSPLPFNLSYTELKNFTDVFKLTNLLWAGDTHLKIYNLLYNFTRCWPLHKVVDRDSLVDLFYIHFLRLSGYFSVEDSCCVCNKKDDLETHYHYEFNLGRLCIHCFENQKDSNGIIIFFNLKILSQRLNEISLEELEGPRRDSEVLRENTLKYLKAL